MLMAEDLLLLVTDDASGRLSAPAAQVDAGLGGANLVELTLRNKVDLSGEGDQGKPGRIIVRDPSPAGDAVLDTALEIIIAHQGKKPSTVIRPLSKNLRQSLYQRLADGGVVRAEQGRILGVFPTHRWPAQDASREAEVRRLVTQVLTQQTAPDARTAALIALLHALRCEDKIVDPRQYGLSIRGRPQGDRGDGGRSRGRHYRRHRRHHRRVGLAAGMLARATFVLDGFLVRRCWRPAGADRQVTASRPAAAPSRRMQPWPQAQVSDRSQRPVPSESGD
jgi:Golgi phosphoprotein 3 (GPP34)